MNDVQRFFHFRGEVYPVHKSPDGFWRDEFGCIYALVDDAFVVDKRIRAGVGPFSFPEGHPANEPAKPHDFKYSCPVYQAFHSRAEADADLYRDFNLLGKGTWWGQMTPVWYGISRILGWMFWENEKTK